MHRIGATLALVAVLASGRISAADSPGTANVRVMVTDGFGFPVPGAVVSLRSNGGWGEAWWLQYPKEDHVAIPPGSYVVSVNAKGFRGYAGVRSFPAGDSFVPLSLLLSDIERPEPEWRPTLVGRVAKNLLTNPPFWVRVVGVISGDVYVCELDKSGTFAIPGAMPGRYMVLVMNAGVLTGSRIVEFSFGSKEIRIDAATPTPAK